MKRFLIAASVLLGLAAPVNAQPVQIEAFFEGVTADEKVNNIPPEIWSLENYFKGGVKNCAVLQEGYLKADDLVRIAYKVAEESNSPYAHQSLTISMIELERAAQYLCPAYHQSVLKAMEVRGRHVINIPDNKGGLY